MGVSTTQTVPFHITNLPSSNSKGTDEGVTCVSVQIHPQKPGKKIQNIIVLLIWTWSDIDSNNIVYLSLLILFFISHFLDTIYCILYIISCISLFSEPQSTVWEWCVSITICSSIKRTLSRTRKVKSWHCSDGYVQYLHEKYIIKQVWLWFFSLSSRDIQNKYDKWLQWVQWIQ